MTLETITYRMKLLSPVHIGCDHVFDPTSFVIRDDENVLVAFEPFSFLKSLSSDEVDKFSMLCKQGTVESLLDIYKFIRGHGQGMEGIRVAVSDDFSRHYRSVLEKPRHLIKRELNSFLINRTAFNPVSGDVYIPGSAFKGSLRTAILNGRHSKKPQAGSFTKWGGNRDLQKAILDGGEFSTDPFSRVKVSDFRPVTETSRKIVYGVDRKKKPTEKEASALYQIFEVIDAGAIFEGSVTLETPDRSAGIRNPVTFGEIENALSAFFGQERRREAREVSNIGASHVVEPGAGQFEMRLGRHSGAECVYINGKRSIRIMTGKKRQSTTLDRATTIWFASDQRKPPTNEGLLPFGWVSLLKASNTEMQESREFESIQQEKQNIKNQIARQKSEDAERVRIEILAQKRLAEQEKQRVEAEALAYPWRPWLNTVEGINDWGMFRQQILDNEQVASWQKVDEVCVAVKLAAERVRAARPDKWSVERENLTAAWLESAGVSWESSVGTDCESESATVPPLVAAIEAYQEYGQFKQSPVDYSELDEFAAQALLQKFKGWGCNGKKAKSDKKKAWKLLQARMRQLK